MAPPQVDNEYLTQIERARRQLDKLISKNKHHYAPLMLHLALHDAGIYGFQTGTNHYLIKSGPNGSIRTTEELSHPSNKGLKEAVDLCENEVKKSNDKITYADLYQLAGVAAVEVIGGPRIEFVPGREDSTGYPKEAVPQPHEELDESTLEKITKRMELEEKDMVALFGGLHQWSLPDDKNKAESKSVPDGSKADEKNKVESKSKPDESKENGKNKVEFKFDNSYFRDLKGERFRNWAETYAVDNNTFKKHYAEAHKKVSERGMGVKAASRQTDQKPSAASASSRNRVRLVQGIGIAVVTTAIILGFFLSRRSK